MPVCASKMLLVFVGFTVAVLPAAAVTMDWTLVANTGNACEPALDGCFGSVSYVYQIGTYEVTNAQYAEFLNAKAASDPLGLYNTEMDTSSFGGITRSGTPGSYTYSTKVGRGDMPVTWVSFFDALRFANWLNNGQGSGDTETGAYTLLGGTALPSNWDNVTRNPGAVIFLPSEDEWYKAAYYDALSGSYFEYPTGTDTQTVCSAPTATANRANCGNVVGDLTIRGSYTGSASPYGTFDQGGNVWEWIEAYWPSGPPSPLVVLRGASYFETAPNLGATSRYNNGPSGEGKGIRVARLLGGAPGCPPSINCPAPNPNDPLSVARLVLFPGTASVVRDNDPNQDLNLQCGVISVANVPFPDDPIASFTGALYLDPPTSSTPGELVVTQATIANNGAATLVRGDIPFACGEFYVTGLFGQVPGSLEVEIDGTVETTDGTATTAGGEELEITGVGRTLSVPGEPWTPPAEVLASWVSSGPAPSPAPMSASASKSGAYAPGPGIIGLKMNIYLPTREAMQLPTSISATVPEPGSVAQLTSGALALALLYRFRRSRRLVSVGQE